MNPVISFILVTLVVVSLALLVTYVAHFKAIYFEGALWKKLVFSVGMLGWLIGIVSFCLDMFGDLGGHPPIPVSIIFVPIALVLVIIGTIPTFFKNK